MCCMYHLGNLTPHTLLDNTAITLPQNSFHENYLIPE